MASLAAHILYERLARLEDLGISVATRVVFEDAVAQGDWAQAKKLVEKVLDDFSYVDLLIVSDTIGASKVEVNRSHDFSINNLAFQDWYKGFAAHRKPYLSRVYLSSGKPQHVAASLAVPIKNKSKMTTGILVMQINVSKLLAWNSTFYHRGKAVGKEYIVDNGGAIALHPDSINNASIIDYNSVIAVQKSLDGEKGVGVYFNPVEQKNFLTAYQRIPKYGWIILLQQEESEAFSAGVDLKSIVAWYAGLLICSIGIGALVVREIDLRMTAEKKLTKSTKLFEDVFEHNPAALAISRIRDKKILHVNQSFLSLFGFTDKADVVGKNAQDLNIWKDSRKRDDMITTLKAKKQIRQLEMQTHELNGELKYTSGSIHLIEIDNEPCILAVALDITDRKRAEDSVAQINRDLETKVKERTEEVIKFETKYRTVIDQASDGIFISDPIGNFIDANATACKMLGYSKEELLRMNVTDILTPEEVRKNPTRFDDLRVGKIILTIRNLKKKNGQLIPAEINSKMLSNGAMLGIVRDISERREAEERLKASETRFRSIIEQFPRPVTTYAPDGQATSANLAWEMMWEDRRESTQDYNILKDDHLEKMGLKKYVLQAFEGEVAVSEPFEYNPAAIGKSGRKRWLQMVLFPVKNDEGKLMEVILIMEDLTSNMQAEMNYREIFEKANDAIYIHEIESGKLIAVNQQAAALTGFTKEELLLVPLPALVTDHPDYTLEHAIAHMQKAAAGEPQRFEWYGKRKDGTCNWYEVHLSRATIGGVDRILAFFNEINDRKNAQQYLEEFNKILETRVEERTRELEELNKELESFTYSVSHDLRAPLRSLNGYSQMLHEDYKDKLDEEGQRIIQTINNNSKRMGKLIDELLEFSRLGRKDLQKTEVDLNSLVEKAIAEICRLTECRATFKVDKLFKVKADYELLYQAVLNLVSNAVKYSSRKDQPKIEISSKINEDGETIFRIEDNGVGFDMLYAHKLFGVFQRLHARHEFEGTGVGLAIVHRIIAKHGGKVWGTAQKDEGATFCFFLPEE